MKPRDLLLDRLRSEFSPFMEEHNFKFAGSSIKYSRKLDSVKQTIQFSLRKWYSEDSCEFWTMWNATSTEYSQWHNARWGEKPANNMLGGSADWNIPGWTVEPDRHLHLTNSENDIAEMQTLRENTESSGFAFLKKISSYDSAAELLISEGRFFYKASDFLMIAGNEERALAVLKAGVEAFKTRGRHMNSHELPLIKSRLREYFGLDVNTV